VPRPAPPSRPPAASPDERVGVRVCVCERDRGGEGERERERERARERARERDDSVELRNRLSLFRSLSLSGACLPLEELQAGLGKRWRAAVKRMWHISDSQGQIMAMAFR